MNRKDYTMDENGLAGAYAQEQGMEMAPSAGTPQVAVQDLVNMLKQGITPEELLQQGVPEAMINQALMMLQQEMQQGQIQPQAPQGGGLADMYTTQGAV